MSEGMPISTAVEEEEIEGVLSYPIVKIGRKDNILSWKYVIGQLSWPLSWLTILNLKKYVKELIVWVCSSIIDDV